MAKIVLASTNSGYNLSVINTALQQLAAELNGKVLYRNNPTGEPNSMNNLLDMNGNAIINAGNVSVSGLSINGVNVEVGEAVAAATTQVFEFTATAGQTSFSVAPLEPTVTAVELEVNGFSIRSSSLTVVASLVSFPALDEGDECLLRIFTREVGATPTADQIVWASTKAGAISTTVANALETTRLNVKTMFGAVGDGVADDTAAILAAIAAATGTLTGYVIYLPAGIYKISSAIVFGDKANMFIVGDGPNLSVIKPTTLVTTALSFGTSGSSYQGLASLHIDCTNATSCIAVANTGIDGFWANDFVISSASIGIDIVNGFGQFYQNFRIESSKTAGIKVNGGNDQFLSKGVLKNPVGAQPTQAGIWIVKNEAIWLTDIDCIYQKHGLFLSPQGTDYISWAFLTSCAFDLGTGDGIRVEPAVGALVKGVTAQGCWTSSNDGYGINITGAGSVDGFRTTTHRSYRNKKSGYYVDTTGSFINVAFGHSEASGNSYTNDGVYSGFDIGAGVSKFSITNCRSGQMAGQTNTQARGILVNAGASNDYVIAGNDVTLNTSSGILDGGTGTTKQVYGNLGFNPEPQKTITVGASPFTYTNNSGSPEYVYVAGGTISNVAINGAFGVVATTNNCWLIPQGRTLVVTYTVAPTMFSLGL